jgi:5-methylcytosine-specific restriction endonuclease McrA
MYFRFAEKLIDRLLLKSFHRKTCCEWCKQHFADGLAPHHVVPRGLGNRFDHKFNLIGLCLSCHAAAGNHEIAQYDLWAVIAQRENVLQDELMAELEKFRRK